MNSLFLSSGRGLAAQPQQGPGVEYWCGRHVATIFGQGGLALKLQSESERSAVVRESYHWEAASLPTRKLHKFPLGNCITSHWETASFTTGKLHHFPLESFLTSQQEAFSLPNRNLPHFPLRSFLTSHQEAFPPLTEKLRPHLSGSFLTSHQEAISLLTGKHRSYLLGSFLPSYREAVSLSTRKLPHFSGRLYWGSSIKDSFFSKINRKNSISQNFPGKSKKLLVRKPVRKSVPVGS